MLNYFRNRKRNKTNEILLKEFNFKDNKVEMVAEHPGFVGLIEELVNMFKKGGGTNYLSMRMYHPDLDFFEVNIQKCSGKTPAELNSELKEEVRRLNGKIDEITKMFNLIVEYAEEEAMNIYFPDIVDKPKGIRQSCDIPVFDHEYVDQRGDEYYGYYGEIYYPFYDKYLEVRFST